MSAICGIVQFDKALIAKQRCLTVQAALEPYGRHGQGLWDGQHIVLGSRLTKLLPEDQYDQQPLQGGNGRFVLIADVRLDNREELGRKLGIPLARLRMMADADVLLAAYELWEQQLLEHLVGDFAFAVWDKQQKTLFLARDQMGRRPLFYHKGDGWFGFASMPAGLLALPEVPMAPDEERIRDLLLLLPDSSSDHSYFAGIYRLHPGHYAILEADGSFYSKRYWAPPTEERIFFKNDDDYVEAFLEKLEEAVRCRLRSAGGIASQLSAGFDSATVTSIAANLLGKDGQKLHAYTSVPNPEGLSSSFQNRIVDESPLAAQVAALFPNIQHHLIRTDDQSIVSMMECMFKHYNRPAKNVINLLWDMSIAQQSSAMGATTLLTGELGNLTISYHGPLVLNTLLREGRLIELTKQLSMQLRNGTPHSRLSVLYHMLMPSLPDSWQSALEQTVDRMKKRKSPGMNIHPDIATSRAFQQYCWQSGRRFNGTKVWYESRVWRQKLLTKRDFGEFVKGTLAISGIDRRDPTVDIRLIRYCQAIPVEQFNKNGINRWLLRRTLTRYWPQQVIVSRIKGLQGADWLYKITKEQHELFREFILLPEQPMASRLFDLASVQKMPDTQLTHYQQANNLLSLVAIAHFLRLASE
ncbi:asparagine synthetase B family protein [Undibacterium squillarum]|uniref:asparagine synthase (glutamine-hydrolyzing) n=1 Tax=Undibacterium squillarum TaxID=1131567 RepID=A0ABQ2XVT4_9BURK|nr:asparagine synthase-related protein [Undibacterium squillarum]GGX36129.1 asparagine synthetase B [Undibacterium squillarum]